MMRPLTADELEKIECAARVEAEINDAAAKAMENRRGKIPLEYAASWAGKYALSMYHEGVADALRYIRTGTSSVGIAKDVERADI